MALNGAHYTPQARKTKKVELVDSAAPPAIDTRTARSLRSAQMYAAIDTSRAVDTSRYPLSALRYAQNTAACACAMCILHFRVRLRSASSTSPKLEAGENKAVAGKTLLEVAFYFILNAVYDIAKCAVLPFPLPNISTPTALLL
jgi:hypothetical protein